MILAKTAWINLANKKGLYLISVSLIILSIWVWTDNPPKEIIMHIKIALYSVVVFNKLACLKPWVISKKPLIKVLFNNEGWKLLSIIVVIIKKVVITPNINNKVLILLIRELVMIEPNLLSLLILLLCIIKIAFFKENLSLVILLGL